MTSARETEASASQSNNSNMDSDSLVLSKYLDLLPQPAMIFTYAGQEHSLSVCYVNKSFLESIGDSPLEEDSDALIIGHNETPVPRDYMTVLQTQCINPSADHFTQWIHGVTHKPEKMHHLKTRFKGFTMSQHSQISDRIPTVVDIEWNAAVMDGKFIILTGRRIGTVKFAHALPPPMEPVVQRDFASPAIIEEEGEEYSQTSEEPQSYSEGVTTSSSSSNDSNPRRGRLRKHQPISSTIPINERTRVGSGSENGTLTNEIDTWRLSEKVLSLFAELMVACKGNRWRRQKWTTITGEKLVKNSPGTDPFLESDASDDDIRFDGQHASHVFVVGSGSINYL